MEDILYYIVIWVVISIIIYFVRLMKKKKISNEMPTAGDLDIYIEQIKRMKSQNASYSDQVNYLKNKGITSQDLIDSIIATIVTMEDE